MTQPSSPISLDQIQRIAEFRAQLRAFLGRSDDVARRWGLTPQRHLLLLMIMGAADGSGRLSLTEIADRLSLSPNTVTELVARAEELGLVERSHAEHDQRVVYISLTEEGEQRLLGTLEENELARAEFNAAFSKLARVFRSTTRA